MPLFRDTAEDEIARLRALVARLEAVKGVQMVTVEIESKPGYGFLFYITAPTMTSEAEFGKAMAETIQNSFRVLGADMKPDVIGGDHVAPDRKGPVH